MIPFDFQRFIFLYVRVELESNSGHATLNLMNSLAFYSSLLHDEHHHSKIKGPEHSPFLFLCRCVLPILRNVQIYKLQKISWVSRMFSDPDAIGVIDRRCVGWLPAGYIFIHFWSTTLRILTFSVFAFKHWGLYISQIK